MTLANSSITWSMTGSMTWQLRYITQTRLVSVLEDVGRCWKMLEDVGRCEPRVNSESTLCDPVTGAG